MSLKDDARRIKNRTITAFEENPILVMGMGAAALSGVAKLMNARTNQKNSKTYRREVARREKAKKHIKTA